MLAKALGFSSFPTPSLAALQKPFLLDPVSSHLEPDSPPSSSLPPVLCFWDQGALL